MVILQKNEMCDFAKIKKNKKQNDLTSLKMYVWIRKLFIICKIYLDAIVSYLQIKIYEICFQQT